MKAEMRPAGDLKVMFADLGRWTQGHLRYAADLLLPPVCVNCHEPVCDHGVLCATCWRDVAFITPPVCDRLGLPLHVSGDDGDGPAISTAALRNPPVFRRARAAARFSGVMRHLIHGFKYSDRHEAAGMFARLMQAAGAELLRDADVLIPVPLHRRKLYQRRFNQSAVLAQILSRLTGIPADCATLLRTRHTASQAGLSQAERPANVSGAFAVRSGFASKIMTRRILLIDDVITTGSTLNACAQALLDAGAAQVDCLAIAMVAGCSEDD